MPSHDEDADKEERETQEAGIEVRRTADSASSHLHPHFLDLTVTPHQVGNRLADVMLIEELGGMDGRAQDVAIDADDAIAGPDPRDLGPAAGHHLAHGQPAGSVGFQHYAVVGTGQKHVGDRKSRHEKGQQAKPQQQLGRTEAATHHSHHMHLRGLAGQVCPTPLDGSRANPKGYGASGP